MTRYLTHKSMSLFAQWFGVITGLIFVGSGVTNAYLFKTTFGLAYSSVATPADVVMSAFNAAYTITMFGAFILAPVLAGYYLVLKPIVKKMSWPFIAVGVIGTVAAVAMTCYIVFATATSQGMISFLVFGQPQYVNDPPGIDKCPLGVVRWSGSSAAIIECGSSTYVVRNWDGLITYPLSTLIEHRTHPAPTPAPAATPKQQITP